MPGGKTAGIVERLHTAGASRMMPSSGGASGRAIAASTTPPPMLVPDAKSGTPGYRARDLTPFRDVLDKTVLTMAATRPGHLELDGPGARPARASASGGWDVVHSGNSVSIEEQLMKSGEVSRDQALNGSVVKAFNRMLALSTKAGQ